MLRLKRASAGSGKTYQLAKTFIKLLLTHKIGKRRSLRQKENLQEALRSIMAVTFTVKATAEMKLRIVDKLAALAEADKKSGEELKDIDYLDEFTKELGVDKDMIAYLAKDALRCLLLHYSDFRVQTIDAFFQSILHTFAYEANLDENFNMELDTDYVASLGLDAALDSIISTDRKKSDRETLYWLRKLMRKEKTSSKWNVFAKRDTKNTVYGDLIGQAKNLEKEEFQIKKGEIDQYFKNLERPFRDVVKEIDDANFEIWVNLYEKRRRAAQALVDELVANHLSIEDIYKKPKAKLKECFEDIDFNKLDSKLQVPNPPADTSGNKFLSGDGKTHFERVKREYPEVNDSKLNDVRSAYLEWVEACAEYQDALDDEALRHPLNTWLHYRETLPALMIVLEIAEKKKEYLEATNTLQISDTASILSRIIGKDETPFIYERMGTRIHHYLIDEFQDTSHMQWTNLRPLLKESDDNGDENLIIGDAKQSIYRFRNADYTLITDKVERDFHDVVHYTTDEKPKDMAKENTNFRSSARIVQFNNYIFSTIEDLRLDDGSDMFSSEIKKIYEGARQHIPSKKLENPLGYVNVTVYPTLTNKEKEGYSNIGTTSLGEPGFQQIVSLIIRLHSRGYDYKDIGVLVRTHDHGQAVVQMISQHNNLHPDAQIPVISKKNLLVASSLSVRIIINALETAMKGLGTKGLKKNGYDEPIDEEELFSLMASLQSQALPSIIEAVADKFVPEKQRNEDTPFLATFQDCVLDYCATHTSDIGSFLKWWKRQAKSLTINTPEDSDGVKIETIHRSKGLEYPCVIVPYLDITFSPSEKQPEWKWVKPSPAVAKAELLPPFLPLESNKSLNATVHKDVYEKHCEEVSLENLNTVYVAFTRAINELYVYCPLKKGMDSAGAVIDTLLQGAEIEGLPVAEESPAPDLGEGSKEYTFGTPLTPEQITDIKKEEAAKKQNRIIPEKLEAYPVSSDGDLLRFKDGNPLLKETAVDDEEELDPRAEGSIKHRILELTVRPEDIDKAILMMKVGGLASPDKLRKWKEELLAAIENMADYGWFDADARIFNERNIVRRNTETHRPDRIVVKGDKAEVIDYKFGKEKKKYTTQVREYCDLLAATGRFRKVEGYIWYVSEGKVEKV